MIRHLELGSTSFGIKRQLKLLIDQGEIVFGGNRKLKIYGRLDCISGRKMKAENRVFFSSEKDAIDYDYRPCGHCMRTEYALWKQQLTNGV
ncbi:MAG: Ada metal-binding domain-containing protein [Mucilaginibacter sp.]|uniref:Ada metal-binding domain-containing protein n=1 Tax=Mucilaginibacter sp. TaxID=1882438 RepID=UPI0032645A22